MWKEDIKCKKKEKADMIEILSRLVYFNTTEIFPAGAELDCKHKLVNADFTT